MTRRRLWNIAAGTLGCAWLAAGCSSGGPPSGETKSSDGSVAVASLSETAEAQAVVASARTRFQIERRDLSTDKRRVRNATVRQSALPEAAAADLVGQNGGRVRTSKRAGVDVTLGMRASDAVELHDTGSGAHASVALEGALHTFAERAGGYLVFRGGHVAGDVLQRLSATGMEDYIVLESAPKESIVRYSVELKKEIAGLRLHANTLELLDAQGAPRIRMSAPYLVDKSGRKVTATVSVQACAFDTSAQGPWGRPVTPSGSTSCKVEIGWDSARVAYPALLDPAWGSCSSMASAEARSSAVRLSNGRVLLAGGYDGNSASTQAELFDPATLTWATTGSLAGARYDHAQFVLADGRVLVSGGDDNTNTLATTEIYDPSAGTWSGAGDMTTVREDHLGVVLPSGKVFVSGGYDATSVIASAEIFDPTARTWSPAASMTDARVSHTATLLSSGKVLVAGGYNDNVDLGSAELYDPAADAWSSAGTLASLRYGHTATGLADGTVIVIAGRGTTSYPAAAELYTPGTNSWSTKGNVGATRYFHSADRLLNGQVLVAGGIFGQTVLSSAELYDPATGTFTTTGSLASARTLHVTTMLNDNRLLVAGGESSQAILNSGEFFPKPLISTGASSYDASTPVVVNWTDAPGAAYDYVAIARAGSSAQTSTRSAYTASQPSGSLSFSNLASDTYVARLYLNASTYVVAESAPFTVVGPTTTVTTDKSTYLPGDSVVVTYANMSGAWTDYISIAPAGSSATTYTRAQYIYSQVNGTISFSNLATGTYVARAYFAGGSSIKAESAPFNVTGATTTVTTDKLAYSAGESVVATYANMSGAWTDYIAIALAGSPATTYTRGVYVYGQVNGSLSFANLPSGTYVARAFFSGGTTIKAESLPFTVSAAAPTISRDKASYSASESVVVSYGGMSGSYYDYVAIAPAGSSATTRVRETYVYGQFSGTWSVANLPTGTYVARAFFANGTTVQAESASFTVTGAPTTVTTDKSSYAHTDTVVVSYANMSGAYNDYIAIAPAGSSATTVTQDTYTTGKLNGTLSFSNLPAGTYVARAYFWGSSTVSAETASFTVLP